MASLFVTYQFSREDASYMHHFTTLNSAIDDCVETDEPGALIAEYKLISQQHADLDKYDNIVFAGHKRPQVRQPKLRIILKMRQEDDNSWQFEEQSAQFVGIVWRRIKRNPHAKTQ